MCPSFSILIMTPMFSQYSDEHKEIVMPKVSGIQEKFYLIHPDENPHNVSDPTLHKSSLAPEEIMSSWWEISVKIDHICQAWCNILQNIGCNATRWSSGSMRLTGSVREVQASFSTVLQDILFSCLHIICQEAITIQCHQKHHWTRLFHIILGHLAPTSGRSWVSQECPGWNFMTVKVSCKFLWPLTLFVWVYYI